MKLLENAHMPFVVELDEIPWLFFCRGVVQTSTFGNLYQFVAWHIHCAPLLDLSQVLMPIQGKFEEPAIQCNPFVYTTNEGVFVSFVCAEIRNQRPAIYQLYTLSGVSMNMLTNFSAVNLSGYRMFNGLALPDTMVMCKLQELRIIRNGKIETYAVGFDEVLRVTRGRDSTELIVTGRTGMMYRSVLFSMTDGTCKGEVSAEGRSVYKCCIYKGKVYHAVRVGGIENRDIHVDDLLIRNCEISFTRVPDARKASASISDGEMIVKILGLKVRNKFQGFLRGMLDKEIL